jgi:6-phosphogluconolactonase
MATTLPRRDCLAGLTGLTAAIATRSWSGRAQSEESARAPAFMYAGCFTTKERGHGEGLAVYGLDATTGKWKLVQLLRDIVNPSYLAVDPRGRFLYSVQGVGTQATAFQIDQKTGQLTVLNHQSTGGKNPVHLAIDATNRFLSVANYDSGSLAILPINRDGSLGPVSDLASFSGFLNPNRRQVSQPHHCPFDPSGRYIVVPDKGQDKVFSFRLDTTSGKLVASKPVNARNNAGPRHAGFHPTKPYAYVLNEQDSSVTAYHFKPEQGGLEPFQILTTLPSGFTGNNTAAEISIAPSGRFLYSSNRGHDSIAIFSIDEATGGLTSVGWEPTQGKTPRFGGLDPTGTHYYAANEDTDTIVVFRVNQSTGRLAATGEILQDKSPVTIVFR